MNVNSANRQKLLIILAGSAVGLLILDSVAVEPLINLWRKHTAQIVKLRTEVTEGRSLIAREAQLRRVWTEMQAAALPKERAEGEQNLVSALDKWGRANNVEVGSIRPQWKKGGTDRYSVLECRVDVTGSMPMLARFLYEAEKSPLPLRVDAVELTAHDDTGQRITLSLLVSGLRLTPLERNS